MRTTDRQKLFVSRILFHRRFAALVSVAGQTSLVAVSGGCSLLRRPGSSRQRLPLRWSQAPGKRASALAARRPGSCDSRA